MIPNPTLRIDLASILDYRRIELVKGALALTEQVFFDAGNGGTLPMLEG